ncbi:MAG TPA: RNA polymerase sigma factor [Steroidobacter sp.]|nr:RNA polymerase sigma factor [Steroidobacter sp.]
MRAPKLFRNTPPCDTAALEFDRLIREHIPALYRSAYRWSGAVDRAEDLVQELLVRLYPLLDELRRLDRVRPWALRVMYRIFVDQLRRERSSPVQFGFHGASPQLSDEEEDSDFIDPSPEPSELAERRLSQERISTAWARLADEHRAVLAMHDIEGYSLVELAAMMEVPIGTLKSRLHRARARLRELLADEARDLCR